MFDKLQGILATRPAAMALALILFAGFTAPFVILQSAHAVGGIPAPLPCSEGNHNGCTDLSATPPEDLQVVPPNLVLMFDDSGSMAWDYMPDWNFIQDTSADGVRNPLVNNLYYDPTTTYTPPPKADSTVATPDLFKNSPGLTNAYSDGFNNHSPTDVTSYTGSLGHAYSYYTWLPTTILHYYGYPTSVCPGGYTKDPNDINSCLPPATPLPEPKVYSCYAGGNSYDPSTHICTIVDNTGETPVSSTYTASYVCPGGYPNFEDTDQLCHANPPPPRAPSLQCQNGGGYYPGQYEDKCVSRDSVHPFTYVTTTPADPVNGTAAYYTQHYVAQGTQCDDLYYASQKANCVNESDTTGASAPVVLVAGVNTLTAGQNVANWFSYYRTRMLMAKSGLMAALVNVDPKYRFGFASINGNGTFASTLTTEPFNDYTADGNGGSKTNELATVQPFGTGSETDTAAKPNSQKAKFWDWLVSLSATRETPLRKALDAVGKYYNQTGGPWTTMPGDPGYTTKSTTKFTCRSSYTILTTDGFWNGDAPTGTIAGADPIAGASDRAGPENHVPAGRITQYLTDSPFSGGGAAGGEPSLADVATYYWANDLNTDFNNDVSVNTTDTASWQHMTTFTIGLGVTPRNITPAGTTFSEIRGWARGGAAITNWNASTSWPTPASNSINNIADLAHAAINGRGDFFNVNNPADLASAFQNALIDIAARQVLPRAVAVNASVLAVGAAAFRSGYQTGDWSGQFQAVSLRADGSAVLDPLLWSADALLNADHHSAVGSATRNVYTGAYTNGTFTPFQFDAGAVSSFDATETAGLETPALATNTGTNDSLVNRINYLLGDITYEDKSGYRLRSSILGAIIHSDPVYVIGATGNYRDSWPSGSREQLAVAGDTAGCALSTTTPCHTYSSFVGRTVDRMPVVYVGANDGMLHAFYAPVPKCTETTNADGTCSTQAPTCTGSVDAAGNCSVPVPTCTGATNPNGTCSANFTFANSSTGLKAGEEAFAFVPRAVYANLGNLTDGSDFNFRPTVDSTPTTRDVFFGGNWQTILTGGVGLGGRGVYALDITDPSTFKASNVLWEFDSDMTIASDCTSIQGSTADSIGCLATDLGYTVSEPNIGRLATGKWVVLVPNGYFPDCGTQNLPTVDVATCAAIAGQVPTNARDAAGKHTGTPYSALFVLDAATGKAIAELKTPSTLPDGSSITSFGLAKPVLGDYESDQVDNVAFAGDAQGNLWRFDMSSSDSTKWSVSLVYKGLADAAGNQGVQPITTMPRLFPDPDSNRFLVLFGTGKYLGVGDSDKVQDQAIYAVRDKVGTWYSQSDLTERYLHETAGTGQNAGATLRCVTGDASDSCTASATPINSLAASKGGWFVNLNTTSGSGNGAIQSNVGERVVVNPGAIFASNTVVFETLITGSHGSDACNPSTDGSILAFNATTGGAAGSSSLGGWPMAGGRILTARTSGNLPVVSALGGGQAYLPGATLAPSGNSPVSLDAPIWRRRSWRVLINDQ